ncbi:MAG TPA: TrkA family potassium uptake protein [Treponemataceae bacterium]|nr:TrkA family potassium uptake protein [Treponemataceae bacterium]
MKQFAVIGLGAFGLRMLEELLDITNEIIIIDRDKEVIDKYKDLAKAAYITDAINEIALKKIIPSEIDAVVVDLGGKIEASIMAISYLKKMGVREIVAKAQTDEHGEILKMMGATKVIFPDREAAKRVTPLLASSLLFNFMPISPNLSLAEVRANEYCVGKTLIDANLRQEFGLNVVAMRKTNSDDFVFISDPGYVFQGDDVLLVAGDEETIFAFSRDKGKPDRKKVGEAFRNFFAKKPETV